MSDDVLAAGAVLWRPAPDGVEIALVHRPRYDDWSLPKGKLDAGETMAAAAVREIEEETGVVVEVEHLLSTGVVGPITFPNGDVCTFLNLDFRCRWISGEARVNDDESLDVRWFTLDALPPLNPRHLALVQGAADFHGVTHFVT